MSSLAYKKLRLFKSQTQSIYFHQSNPISLNMNSLRTWSDIQASAMAQKTFSPIRNVVETMTLTPNPTKKVISLSIGDPTVFGNLRPPKSIIDAVYEGLSSGNCNGYSPSTG